MMQTTLHNDEKVLKTSSAKFMPEYDAVAGNLYLTNRRLIFEPNSFNAAPYRIIEIKRDSIELISKSWKKLIGIPILPNIIKIQTDIGQDFTFIVFNRISWLNAMLPEKISTHSQTNLIKKERDIWQTVYTIVIALLFGAISGFFVPDFPRILPTLFGGAIASSIYSLVREKSFIQKMLSIFLIIFLGLIPVGIGIIIRINQNEEYSRAFEESFIESVIENFNTETSVIIDDDLLYVNSEQSGEKEIKLNWQIYSLSKNDIDITASMELDRKYFITVLNSLLKMPELFRDRGISFVFSVSDKDNTHLYNILFTPENY